LPYLCLWPFSWAIDHSFGVLGRFTWPMTLSTCLRGKYSKASNSSFERHREPKHNRRTIARARE
jgi:hypothetical protein